jgi:hypothetical protein
MNVTELRIGNLVEYYVKIMAVNFIDSEKELIGFKDTRFSYKNYSISLAKPITLTEEWLLKFGFVKIGVNFRKYDNYDKGNREFILFYNHNSKNYEIKANNNFYEVIYVHEIQNLYFALTKEELKHDN